MDSSNQTSTAMLGQAQGLNSNMGALIAVLRNAFPLSAYTGTFTCTNAVTTTVTDAHVKTSSFIFLQATNAAAGTLQGSAKNLFITPAVGSFAAATASGVAAAGTEKFNYIVVNVG